MLSLIRVRIMINVFKNIYHFLLAGLGCLIYRRPSRKIFVMGVTGTKGKSTVVELINVILERAGRRTALLSSLRKKIDNQSAPNVSDNTMPGRFTIQRFLAQAVKAGCDYALIEVTSQGVIQHRHRFIDWDAAAVTNLAPEHIEAHGSFEKYRQAKVNFFRYVANSAKPLIFFLINAADNHRFYFEEAAMTVPKAKREIIFFTPDFLKNKINLQNNHWLAADFNLANAALAAVFARSQKISWQIIKEALENFQGVPGRLDFIQKEPFAVIIDYAHTPDSLEKIYQIVRPENLTPGRIGNLICVLGSAGGGRDKWKRPVMGRIAAEYCDKIILTDEDSYDEKPEEIIAEIEAGFELAEPRRLKTNCFFKIIDRRQAIQKAISLAQPGDTVILTGKGSENCIHLARGKKMPWNERKITEEILNSLIR